MGRKKQRKPQTILPPVDTIKLTRAFAGAVQLLRRQWDSLNFLFVADKDRHRALAEFAPDLSDAAALAFTVMVYSEIAKLHDPAISMNQPNKRNLVLRRVIDEIAPPAGTAERTAIEHEYAKIQPTVKKIKEFRNRFGAHQDLLTFLAVIDHALDPTKPHPMPRILLKELEDTVTSIVAIADAVVAFREPTLTWYEADVISRDVERFIALFTAATAGTKPADAAANI